MPSFDILFADFPEKGSRRCSSQSAGEFFNNADKGSIPIVVTSERHAKFLSVLPCSVILLSFGIFCPEQAV